MMLRGSENLIFPMCYWMSENLGRGNGAAVNGEGTSGWR